MTVLNLFPTVVF